MPTLMQEILNKTKAVPLAVEQSIDHSRQAGSNDYATNPATIKASAEHVQTASLNDSLGLGFLYSVSGRQGDI